MPFTEDLSVFFDTDDFAVTGTWQSTSVDGIFDAAYADVLGVATSGPRFVCASARVVGVAQGQTIVINAVSYRIVNVEPDGTGVTVLQLARA